MDFIKKKIREPTIVLRPRTREQSQSFSLWRLWYIIYNSSTADKFDTFTDRATRNSRMGYTSREDYLMAYPLGTEAKPPIIDASKRRDTSNREDVFNAMVMARTSLSRDGT
jgi:hypothetical protein